MRSLKEIKLQNAEHQAKHFETQLKQAIKFCPEGFTLDFYGNIYKGKGYAVGFGEVIEKDCLIYVKNAFIYDVGYFFIGGWFDSEKLVLDAVQIFQDKQVAIDYGKVHNQKAIYDFEKKETIYL